MIEYIDWSPFFHAWELRGRYPAIFDDPKMGQQARELFDDAQELLGRIAAKDLLVPRGVYAFWPANAAGDDVRVYADDARTEKIATFYFLRQQMQKPPGQFNYCVADYIAPADGGHRPALTSSWVNAYRPIGASGTTPSGVIRMSRSPRRRINASSVRRLSAPGSFTALRHFEPWTWMRRSVRAPIISSSAAPSGRSI